MKRLISCFASDTKNLKKEELFNAIKASEGRTVMSEIIVAFEALLKNISNCELAKAFGADMLLLNLIDLNNPKISGIPECDNPIALVKEYTGCTVGVNLEPVDLNVSMQEDRVLISEGRQATINTFKKANELGVDYICLTGNPGVGVSNKCILEAIKEAKKHFDGLIIAGKMHGAGSNESVFDLEEIKKFIEAGADIILVPAVSTVPGVTENDLKEAVNLIHSKGKLVMSAIGTSQEGADKDTIREIALACKRAGVDIQHIGDCGLPGMAVPENIMAMSVAIRGIRHTYFRMAASIKR